MGRTTGMKMKACVYNEQKARGDIQPTCHMDLQDNRSGTSGNGMNGKRPESWCPSVTGRVGLSLKRRHSRQKSKKGQNSRYLEERGQ